MIVVAIEPAVLDLQQAQKMLLEHQASEWVVAGSAGSADFQSLSAFAEGGLDRTARNSGVESLDLVAGTIRVEVRHKASRGSPVLEGDLEAQTVDGAAEVHRDGSRVGKANAEGIVEAVAGAAGSKSVAVPDLSMVGARQPAGPVVASVRAQRGWDDEHSVGEPSLVST